MSSPPNKPRSRDIPPHTIRGEGREKESAVFGCIQKEGMASGKVKDCSQSQTV